MQERMFIYIFLDIFTYLATLYRGSWISMAISYAVQEISNAIAMFCFVHEYLKAVISTL